MQATGCKDETNIALFD